MIDFRSEDGVREAFKTVAGWHPPADAGQAAHVLPLEDTRPASRRRSVWFSGAAAAVVLAVLVALVARDPGEPFAAADGEWTTMAPSPLEARFAPISLWTGDELIVWGGHDRAGDEYLDGAAYDPITDTWRQIADFPFEYRRREGAGVGEDGSWTAYGAPGAWFEDRALFVVSNDEEPWAWDLVAYDPVADAWEVLDSARFDQRGDVPVLRDGTTTVPTPTGIVTLDGQLYVFGWHAQRYELGWSTFDPSTIAWSPFTGIPGSGPLYSSLAFATPGPLIVDGHVAWLADRFFDDSRPLGYAIEPQTGNTTLIPSPREALSLRIGDIAGDGVVTGLAVNEDSDHGDGGRRPVGAERFAARLNPSTGEWTELDAPPSGANDENAFGRLVAAGNTTILTGGLEWDLVAGGLDATPSQLALDPENGRWHRLPDAPIDLSRTDHVSVWTGERLLVWGGATTGDRGDNRITVPLDDGAQYVP